MKLAHRMWIRLAVFLPLAIAGAWVFPRGGADEYRPFSASMVAGDHFAIDANKLHPTQMTVSFREVAHKAKRLQKMSLANVISVFKQKTLPVVIGPGGIAYLTDRHHTARALIDSDIVDKTAYGQVIANWSQMQPAEFWEKMRQSNYVHLVDSLENSIDPAALPNSLRECSNSPYRGLVWAVEQAGGIAERDDLYFQEFAWVIYFRPLIQWDDADNADFKRAVNEAMKLAHDPAAANLPGYSPTPLPPQKD
jgi:hypothetical protein